MTKEEKIESGKDNIADQFDPDSSAWIEGWICGFTDPVLENPDDEEVRDALFEYLKELKNRRR